jgi:predicted dehydrogenase
MTKLKAGVVGCGLIAKKRHLPALISRHDSVEVTAVCDMNYKLARDTASEFSIRNSYSDFSEMITREGLDLVDICTPPQAHAELVKIAANHGCNVLVEKPLATNLRDCDAIESIVRSSNAKICTVHNNIFHPAFMAARRKIAAGELGEIKSVNILLATRKSEFLERKNHWVHKLPGGLIGETGPHVAYMALALIGEAHDVQVEARNVTETPWTPFDEYYISMAGKNAYCTAASIYHTKSGVARLDVAGELGSLSIDLQLMTCLTSKRTNLSYQTIAKEGLSTFGSYTAQFASNAMKLALGRLRLGHEVIISQFLRSVADGTPPPVSFQEARDTVAIVEKIVSRLPSPRHSVQ